MADQVTLVPNGVETAMFDPDADGTAVRRGFSLNRHFVVIYAGAHGLARELGVVVQAADHGHRRRIWQSAWGYVEAYSRRRSWRGCWRRWSARGKDSSSADNQTGL